MPFREHGFSKSSAINVKYQTKLRRCSSRTMALETPSPAQPLAIWEDLTRVAAKVFAHGPMPTAAHLKSLWKRKS